MLPSRKWWARGSPGSGERWVSAVGTALPHSPGTYEPSHVAMKHGEKIKLTYSSRFSRGQLLKKKKKKQKEKRNPSAFNPGAIVWERSRERLLEALAGLGVGRERAMPPDPCLRRGDRPPAVLTAGRSGCTPNLRTERLAGPTPGTGSLSLAAATEFTRISRAGLKSQGSPGET